MASVARSLSVPLLTARAFNLSSIPFVIMHLAALAIFFRAVSLVLRARLLCAVLSRGCFSLPPGTTAIFRTARSRPAAGSSSCWPLWPRLLAEGNPVVGSAPSPPPPLFRPGTGPAFAHAARLSVGAYRLDSFRRVQRHALRLHRRLREIPGAALAQQIPSRSAHPLGADLAHRRLGPLRVGILPQHHVPVARHLYHQFAVTPVWQAPVSHRGYQQE